MMRASFAIRRLVPLVPLAAIAVAIVHLAPTELVRANTSTTRTRVYVSTYGTDRGGIYLAAINPTTGELQLIRRAAAVKNVQFLALHPNHRYLYATCDVDDYQDTMGGAVAAFKIDASTGNLTPLNHQSSGGALPCHVSVDRQGKYALVANYVGGSVAVLPISADGTLGRATSTVFHEGSSVNKVRQTGPHPHAINLDPTNRFAFVADLGLDKVLAYRFDIATGTLALNDPGGVAVSPGAGPRHLAFHPNGKWAYVINELDSTVIALRCDSKAGALTLIDAISTLPDGATEDNITGEIVVHPSGKFLYGSNRGQDSIAVFEINQESGRLVSIGHHSAGGRTPRNFNIDPSGKFLLSANLDSDSITVHQIDLATGKLLRTAHEIKVLQPHCIEFYPLVINRNASAERGYCSR